MEPGRWLEIEETFHRLEPLDAEQCQAALAEIDDTELRCEVEGLLLAHEEVGGQLEGAVQSVLGLAAEDAAEETLDRQRIGPYQVLRELGRGGLSTVFLGQRDDEDFPLKVAIKVVKRGMDTRDILRRLRQERRILASLDHPNISRLMDGGSTEDGLPYFVMEYIEGQTIDEYCEAQNLGLDARLTLFRQVCAAVHSAHQSLIVHRDIKPGNLMVTHDGIPKLLDFGIAKLMTPEVDGTDAPGLDLPAFTATAAGLRLLTPEYASPEQVRGEPLTTATDIYSLGVLLYRLLTDEMPYDVNRQNLSEMERIICEQHAERPSALLARLLRERQDIELVADSSSPDAPRNWRSQRLARRLRGDLDNIVLMALRKEPQRRYASAQQLADDLRRHQEGMPVVARRDTFGYRTGKFIRRNRLGVFAAALVALSLVIGMLATTHQANRARTERQRAEDNLQVAQTQRVKAERVGDFLVGIFEIADPGEARGNEVTARELLDQGAERISDGLDEEPEVQSAMMDTMGRVYSNLGLYPQADSLLSQALEIRQNLFGEEHLEVAASLDNLASLERLRGDYDASRSRFEEALRLRRELLGPRHLDVAESLNNLAVLEDAQGNTEVAEELFKQALEIRLEALGPRDLLVAETINNLAVINYRRRDFEAAESLFRRALDIRQLNYPEGVHPRIALTLNNLAAVYQELGRLEEAEDTLLKVLAMRRQLLDPEHPDLGYSLNSLAHIRRLRGDLIGAEAANREAIEIFERALKTDHPNFMSLTYSRGEILLDLGRFGEARSAFEESLALRRKLLPDGHPRTSYPLVQLGRLAFEAGDLPEAERFLRDALVLQVRHLSAEDTDLAETRGWLGLCLMETQPEEATELLRAGFEVLPESSHLRVRIQAILSASAPVGN